MKQILGLSFLFSSLACFATGKDSTINYSLPDSIKAISFLVDVSVSPIKTKKEVFVGIKTDVIKLSMGSDNKKRKIVFEFPKGSLIMANSIGIKTVKDELSWKYDWKEDENYKLLIATASDSAENFALYSGYIFLPDEKKWKLIGTCKITGQWNTLKQPTVFGSSLKNATVQFNVNEAWCQRQNGSWKNMLQTNFTPPIVNLYSHVDSLPQLDWEKYYIGMYINKHVQSVFDTLMPYKEHDGVYMKIIKEGTGRQVSVTDTVVVFYKGYLFFGNSIFDETKDKPATFPLNRLIKGWQLGVPLCKVGAKIKLIIPSNLAYSIRTRAAKIPPNSILVFEIEVVDAKPPQ